MPCNERPTYLDFEKSRSQNDREKDIISLHQSQRREAEAIACAILTELEKRGIANEIISDAEKNGKVNISFFWAEHIKSDESRAALDLRNFSQHEIDRLKKMISEGKI